MKFFNMRPAEAAFASGEPEEARTYFGVLRIRILVKQTLGYVTTVVAV